MRVALDVSAMPSRLAGAGRYVAELAQRLPQLTDVTLVTRRGDVERWRSLSSASVASPVPDGRASRLAYEALLLGRSAAARGADVWHAPHYTMPRTGKTPTVVTIHDLTFFTNPEWHEASKVAFFKRAISYASTHADVVVCVSDYTKTQLAQWAPTARPVVVAPHGVDLTRFRPDASGASLTEALPSTAPFILFVGTFEPRKGIDVLLEAFTHVAEKHLDVELWLAGQSGWGMAGAEQQLAQHPFASRIRRLGFVSDDLLPELYRRASVVAYPSRGEGFGLPVLEAMACGAVVVTSSDTVMAEVAGAAALYAPVGNSEGVAAAIESALTASDEQRSHRRAAAITQASTFTWERSIAQHLEAYDMAANA